MADFLTRLVQRAQGLAPQVRPDIPPVFGMDRGDNESAASVRPGPALAPVEQDGEGDAIPTRPPRANALFADASFAQRVEQDSDERGPVRVRADTPHVEVREMNTVPEGNASRRHDAIAPPAIVTPMLPLVRPADNEQERTLPAAPLAREQQAPIVKVTIGRIDVRAAVPSSVTSTPRPAQPSTLRSLDDYLRDRNGRRA